MEYKRKRIKTEAGDFKEFMIAPPKKTWTPKRTESVKEYLARGGKITKVQPQTLAEYRCTPVRVRPFRPQVRSES